MKKGQIVRVDKEKYLNSVNVRRTMISHIIGLVSIVNTIDLFEFNVSVSFCWAPTLLQRIRLHL